MAQLFIHHLHLSHLADTLIQSDLDTVYTAVEMSLSMRQLDLAQWANNSVRFLFLSSSLCPSLAHSLSLPASHSTYSSIPYTLSLTVCLCHSCALSSYVVDVLLGLDPIEPRTGGVIIP
jgi:hypothetical protein